MYSFLRCEKQKLFSFFLKKSFPFHTPSQKNSPEQLLEMWEAKAFFLFFSISQQVFPFSHPCFVGSTTRTVANAAYQWEDPFLVFNLCVCLFVCSGELCFQGRPIRFQFAMLPPFFHTELPITGQCCRRMLCSQIFWFSRILTEPMPCWEMSPLKSLLLLFNSRE